MLNERDNLKFEVEKVWNKLSVHKFNSKKRRNLLLRSLFSKLPYPVHTYFVPALKKVYNIIEKESFDAVIIASPYVAACLDLTKIRKQCKALIVDINESDTALWKSYAKHGSLMQRLFAKLQLIKTKRLERLLYKKSDYLLFVSEKERQMAEKNIRDSGKLLILPNGVDPDYFKPQNKKPKKNSILFCGALDVRRNADAVIWFAKRVFPLVRRKLPDVQLNIVGGRAGSEVRQLGSFAGMNFIGDIKDIRDAYSKNSILAAPYKFGGGTRLKILECLSMQVPVVATPAGVQGINLHNIPSIFIANEQDFAKQTINLLENYEKIKKTTPKGRRLVKEHYSWKGVVGKFLSKLEELVKVRS